jgi:6-phosphogluconolactonase/glucosamine-6-phosphate isomerase/deaminase
MHVEIVDDLAEPVGELWRDRQRSRIEEDGAFKLAAPLSSTPLPVYEWVVEHADDFASWPSVEFVLMHEQLEIDRSKLQYISLDDEASYERFARLHLLDPLKRATGCVIPLTKPAIEDLHSYDVTIDLLILALGVEGNYANGMAHGLPSSVVQ